MADQILRPLLITRIANAFPGLAVGLFAVAAVLDGDLGLRSPLVVTGLVLGGFVAVRGYNLSVECAGQHVTVRGYLWTTTISRADIIEITDFPAVTWRSGGRRRWSPLWALGAPARAFPAYQRHAALCVGRLRRWLR
jgi:hypothetical protein